MTDCAHKEIVPTNEAETDGKCEKCGASFPIGKAYLSSGKPFYYIRARRLSAFRWFEKQE